ncbi:hypothetical protein [Neptunomonas antarctica]|nr:hypothetical protein [Neptunomonas antarctica]
MNSNGEPSVGIKLIDFDKEIKVDMVIDYKKIPNIESYGFSFELTEVHIDKNIITVKAKTKNTSTSDKLIYSYAYPANSSPMVLSIDIPRKATLPPLPAQLPPGVVKWKIPAMCEVLFTAKLNLDDYEYIGAPAVSLTANLGLKQKYNTYATKILALPKR